MLGYTRNLLFVSLCLHLTGCASSDIPNFRRRNIVDIQKTSLSSATSPFVQLVRDEDRDEVLLTKSTKLMKVYNAPSGDEVQYRVIAVASGAYVVPGIELEPQHTNYGDLRIYSIDFDFPGNYDIFVHQVKKEKSTQQNKHTESATLVLVEPSPIRINVSWDDNVEPLLIEANQGMEPLLRPPCQSEELHNRLQTDLRGYWLGPDAPTAGLQATSDFEGNMRSGWSFFPQKCSLETFTSNELHAYSSNHNEPPTSIAVVGTIVERGIFFSLLDLALDKQEKENIDLPTVGSDCFGRISVQKGRLNFHYQALHTDVLNADREEYSMNVTCYNDKIAPNATQSIQTLFQDDEKKWPQVILLFSGCKVDPDASSTDHHCVALVKKLISAVPKSWKGTLYLNDEGLHGLTPAMTKKEFAGYHKVLRARSDLFHRYDTRVRWVDSVSILTSMKRYGETPGVIHETNHLHQFCNHNIDNQNNIRVCSNVTEALAQLLLSRALAPEGKSKWHASPGKPVINGNVIELDVTCAAPVMGSKNKNERILSPVPLACPLGCMKNEPVGYMMRNDYNDATVAVRSCGRREKPLLRRNHHQ